MHLHFLKHHRQPTTNQMVVAYLLTKTCTKTALHFDELRKSGSLHEHDLAKKAKQVWRDLNEENYIVRNHYLILIHHLRQTSVCFFL